MNILRRNLEYLIDCRYTLAQYRRYRRYVRRRVTGRPPLILFQMGKVGSTSLFQSLVALPIEYDIFHVHVLSPGGIERVRRDYRAASRGQGRTVVRTHVLSSMYLRELLDRDFDRREWRVISMVREPIARNVSSFFQVLPRNYPELAKWHYDTEREREQHVREITRAFVQHFEGLDAPTRWFEINLEPVFGIDIYQTPFPKQQGYQILRRDNVSVLLMRLESLSTCAVPALRQFIGVEGLVLGRQNAAEQKCYAQLYEQFKERLILPESYLQRMYGSRYMRHFYTDEETERFRRRWAAAGD